MASLTSLPVDQLLDAFASNEPLPAGGSAAALTGALGASVLLMVATLPKTRSGAGEEMTELAAAAVRLRPVRDRLVELVQRDTDAYASLLAALRSPRNTETEQGRRQEGIASAMRLATETPLETMRTAHAALQEAAVIARSGSRAAAGDVAAAVELLLGSVRAAGRSVHSNIAALKTGDYADRLDGERRRLEEESTRDAGRVRDALE